MHRTTANTKQQHWLLERLQTYAQLIQNLAIIFGIFTGVVSLFYTQFEKRVGRTLDFSKDFNATVRSDYINVVTKWNKFAQARGNFSEKKPDEMRNDVLEFFKNDQDAEKNMNNILEFYDTLYVCIDNGSCDRNAAIELLGRQVKNTFEIFAFYIFDRRKAENDETVGEGLERLYRMEPQPFLARFF